MKKVMVLAPEGICDCLRDALDKTYITLPCSYLAASEELLWSEPDVLILYLCLPGADGLTFLKEHATSLPTVIIALTPFLSEDLLQELSRFVVSAVFRVPCRIDVLTDKLSRLLTKRIPSQ